MLKSDMSNIKRQALMLILGTYAQKSLFTDENANGVFGQQHPHL